MRQRFLLSSEDFLTVMLSFGFQTTIIINSRPAFPGKPRQQVSEKQTDCKYTIKSVDAKESHRYIHLASNETKC